MATETQIDELRGYIGTSEEPYTTDDLYFWVDELGSVEAAAHKILRERLADMLDGPASFSVPGYSENKAANIEALRKTVSSLESYLGVGVGSQVVNVPVTRAGRRGR